MQLIYHTVTVTAQLLETGDLFGFVNGQFGIHVQLSNFPDSPIYLKLLDADHLPVSFLKFVIIMHICCSLQTHRVLWY